MFKTLGQLLLGSIFIVGGASAFAEPGGRVQKVEAAGLPQPRQATIANGGIMVVAGAALAAGVLPKLSATALLGSLTATTIVGHPFWKEETPAARSAQQLQFLKNVSVIGGLLLVLANNDD
ncbi:DoxX family membrane protein [Dictyobacter kobayashii]|nr:DoxX family membrane protein [Dictyobacter kobayashii]